MKRTIKELNEALDAVLGEETLLTLTKLADDKYTLDGKEFYVGEDEDLDNAIDICIEEDILPEIQKEQPEVTSYYIDYVDMGEDDTEGKVCVVFYA